jgi:hypothetical protein
VQIFRAKGQTMTTYQWAMLALDLFGTPVLFLVFVRRVK